MLRAILLTLFPVGPPMVPWLDGIQDAFVNAIKGVIELIANAFFSIFEGIYNLTTWLFVTTPAPVSQPVSSGTSTSALASNPGAIFQTCASMSCSSAWQTTYNIYATEAVPIGIALALIGIMLSQGMKPISSILPTSALSDTQADKVTERGVLALIGIALWWNIGSFILELSFGITQGIMGMTGGSTSIGAIGGKATFLVALLGAVVYLASASTLIIVAAFWLLRFLLIYFLMAAMPIIFGLWTFRVGPLESIADFSRDVSNAFIPLAFATVPAALVLQLGHVLASQATTMLSSSLSGTTWAVGLAMFLVGAIVPVLAGIVPIWFFKNNAPRRWDPKGLYRKAQTKQSQYSSRLEETRERNAQVMRQATAARSALSGGSPMAIREDDQGNRYLAEAENPEEAALGSRFGSTVLSAKNQAERAGNAAAYSGKRAADLTGKALLNPTSTANIAKKGAGKRAIQAEQRAHSSLVGGTKSSVNSLSTVVEEAKDSTYGKAVGVGATAVQAADQARRYSREQQELSEEELAEEFQEAGMEARRTFSSAMDVAGKAGAGAATTAKQKAAPSVDTDTYQETSPGQRVSIDDEELREVTGKDYVTTDFATGKDKEVVRTPTGYDGPPVVTEDIKDEFATDDEGNILVNDKNEAIPEGQLGNYMETEDGRIRVDDDGQVIQRNVVITEGGPKKSTDGKYVTRDRLANEEYLSPDEVGEDILSSHNVEEHEVRTYGGETKTVEVITDAQGNIMKEKDIENVGTPEKTLTESDSDTPLQDENGKYVTVDRLRQGAYLTDQEVEEMMGGKVPDEWDYEEVEYNGETYKLLRDSEGEIMTKHAPFQREE